MLLDHSNAFATFTAAPATPFVTVTGDTMLETRNGFCPAAHLSAGDVIATRDGGYATITAITQADAEPMILVPGGTLSACSDVLLPASAFVALTPPAALHPAPLVAAPLRALIGWRGIRPAIAQADLATLHFAEEELIFAQTGLMLHAALPGTDTFFDRLDVAQTRTLLAACNSTRAAAA